MYRWKTNVSPPQAARRGSMLLVIDFPNFSETTGGMERIFSKDIPLFDVLMMVAESMLSNMLVQSLL